MHRQFHLWQISYQRDLISQNANITWKQEVANLVVLANIITPKRGTKYLRSWCHPSDLLLILYVFPHLGADIYFFFNLIFFFLNLFTKGEPACTFYARNGSCKQGAACKFDHPFVAVCPIQEPPPYQMGYNFTWTTGGDSFGRIIPKAPGETVKFVRITELPDDNEENEDSKTQISPSYTAPQSDWSALQSD